MSDPHLPPNSPLDYQAPTPSPNKNKWWMVTLRVFAGIAAALVSGGMGWALVNLTHIAGLFMLPPALMFGVLLFICLKYGRYGYVTGFILAPFLVVTTLIIILAIACGTMAFHP